MPETVTVPSDRNVRASLDAVGSMAMVVACPPHPQYGGSRSDGRLQAIADALNDRSIGCLRIDYGPWDGGRGEFDDVAAALSWATDRADRVGLFGYSFGAGMALRVAAGRSDLCAVGGLAPPSTSVEDGDVVAAIDDIIAPLQVVVGERDTSVEWAAVADRAAATGAAVERVPGDHFFVGQTDRISELMSEFFDARCL